MTGRRCSWGGRGRGRAGCSGRRGPSRSSRGDSDKGNCSFRPTTSRFCNLKYFTKVLNIRLVNDYDFDHNPVTDFLREIDRLTGCNRLSTILLNCSYHRLQNEPYLSKIYQYLAEI